MLTGCCALFFAFDTPDGALSAVITTDHYQLSALPGTAQDARLRAIPLGGRPPYSFCWTATDPANGPADDLLDSPDAAEVRFTAGPANGPYEIRCSVTDSGGEAYAARVILQVGTAVGLDVTTDRVGVVAGGGPRGRAAIHLTPDAGTPPFEVTWIVTGPDGQLDNNRLDTTDPLAPIFTSSERVGTYVLTATIVDANGTSSVESVVVLVGQVMGLDVVASRSAVLPGGGPSGVATLLATPIGGREPYSFDWEVIGPGGQLHNELLWDTAVRSPEFESGDVSGSFLARCAVTDADGTVLIGSTAITVGQGLSVDVVADRLALPAGAGEQATLSADVLGGRDPVRIEWSVAGPDGVDDPSRLSATDREQVVFTPGSASGSYVVRGTVADADSVSATDSLVLTVGGAIGATVVAEKTSLMPGGAAPAGTAALSVEIHGGVAPFSHAWSVINPSGTSEPERLDDTASASPTFSSAAAVGTYTVVCTATDAGGMKAADAVHIDVGQPLNVDVAVDKQALVEGGGVSGQAQLITTINGGVPPYSHDWSVTGPNNTPAPTRMSDTQIPNPVFTSDPTTGTYRLTLTTTDSLGVLFVDSVGVVVSSVDVPDQSLALDISIDRRPVPPFGEEAVLTAAFVGGVAPLDYAWTLTEPGGTTNNALLDSTSAPVVTFTSTATQGTYRAQCTVSDAVGNEFTDSVQFNVSDSFSLDLTAAVTVIGPGGTVNLFADRTGGAADLTYLWSCFDESDALAGTFSTGSIGVGSATQVAADDVTNAWTAPPAGTGSLGSYRIVVELVDAMDNISVDSAQIVVQNPLTLNLTANDTFVAPSTLVTLLADQLGGETPYTYTWLAEDSAGVAAGTFTVGAGAPGTAEQSDEAGDATNEWSVPTTGTYTLTCTITDDAGQSITDSISVVVTTQQSFTLDVTTDLLFVPPGETVDLFADQTGGTSTFDYAWSVIDEAGAAAGTLGAANQTDLADDAANTWTAPSGASVDGTYRIACTVTDAVGRTSTDTTSVVVGSNVLQNYFPAPAAADTDGILAETLIAAAATGGAPGHEINAGLTSPSEPRNVVIVITDQNNNINSATARVTGLNARGQAQSEVISITPSAGGGSTTVGAVPFATVTTIELYDFDGLTTFPPANADRLTVGRGDKFGLTGVLMSELDVLYINEGGTVDDSGFTVDATAGQQGVSFATPPNGVRDYIVVFRSY